MHILVNQRRYKSSNPVALLHRMQTLFPRGQLYLEIDEDRKVDICNDVQLEFAVRVVTLWHTRQTETERMEEEARRRLLEPDSDTEKETSEDDMTQDFYAQIGFKHEHY